MDDYGSPVKIVGPAVFGPVEWAFNIMGIGPCGFTGVLIALIRGANEICPCSRHSS